MAESRGAPRRRPKKGGGARRTAGFKDRGSGGKGRRGGSMNVPMEGGSGGGVGCRMRDSVRMREDLERMVRADGGSIVGSARTAGETGRRGVGAAPTANCNCKACCRGERCWRGWDETTATRWNRCQVTWVGMQPALPRSRIGDPYGADWRAPGVPGLGCQSGLSLAQAAGQNQALSQSLRLQRAVPGPGGSGLSFTAWERRTGQPPAQQLRQLLRVLAAPGQRGQRPQPSVHPTRHRQRHLDLDRDPNPPSPTRHPNRSPRIGERHHEAHRRPHSGRPVGHYRRRKPAAERRRLPVPLVVVITELPQYPQHPQGSCPPHPPSKGKSTALSCMFCLLFPGADINRSRSCPRNHMAATSATSPAPSTPRPPSPRSPGSARTPRRSLHNPPGQMRRSLSSLSKAPRLKIPTGPRKSWPSTPPSRSPTPPRPPPTRTWSPCSGIWVLPLR